MRIELPRGQFAELCEPEDITGEQKRAYQRHIDKAMFPDGTPAAPQYIPDPDNSAVMIPAPRQSRRLTADDIIGLRDMVHGWCVTSWSYDLPLEPASFSRIPAMADDAIERALEENGCYDVFNSAGPKETKATEPTSSATSEDTAPAPLPG